MNRQRWDDDTRQQARALYVADGARLAAAVTQVPERTVREWARVGNWRQADPATEQAPDQDHAPLAPGGAGATDGAKGVELPTATGFGMDPARELARDLALARRVFRLQADRLLEGAPASSGAYRDAAVALGILEDKAAKRGLPGAKGGDFTWERHLAENQARQRRVVAMLRELLPVWRERARVAGNGAAHG